MLEWFQDEDVFNTVHKHHIVIVPCTETFDIPHTTLYPRLMRRFRNEVKIIQHRASVGDKTKCCNCISTGENSPKLIFIPCMRKNKESGIICPDIDILRKALIKIRHCTLNARVSIAFDVYSFFYYDFEKELVTPQQQANNEGLEKILMYLPHEQNRVDDAENLFGNDYGSDDDLFTIIGNSDN